MRATAVAMTVALAALAAAVPGEPSLGPKDIVPGKAFDRIVFIWLENTDYDIAAGDPSLASLAPLGITLDNKYAVTHPSEPNYASSFSGDYFGIDDDGFDHIPQNVSTVVDLLEARGISWGHYEEDLPYTGFEGAAYTNQKTGANDYVRKHNPAALYDSIADDPNRLNLIKNFTLFYEDLAANALPQWIFITPNMTNDGHDSSVTVAGAWAKSFLTPLLTNPNFASNTLVVLTFDECETYLTPNRIWGLLLGDAVPAALAGTTDSTFYDHYSQLSTVEANWGLDTLGRFDVGANVYKFVADQTGDVVRAWENPPFDKVQLQSSYPGLFNSVDKNVPFPAPNVSAVYSGRSVLPAIADLWSGDQADSYYTTAVEIPDGEYHPVYHG